MVEPRIVDFQPHWQRGLSDAERRLLEENPAVGSVPEGPPRLITHLVLAAGQAGVSFRSLAETLERTQAVAQFAACDVCQGVNPDFADLGSANREVLQLGQLTAEPFEEGNFAIPARLEGPPVPAPPGRPGRSITPQDVLARFAATLAAFAQSQPVTDVSIGALQALEALGQVLRREVRAVEFVLTDSLGRSSPPIRVDAATMARVSAVRQARRPSQASLEQVQGTITALDLAEQKLVLSLEPGGQRLKGTYPALFQPTLIECLGRPVRLLGLVQRQGKRMIAIRVESVSVPAEVG